jgi:hypothetical protein
MIDNFGTGRSDRPYYFDTIKIRDLFVRTSRTPSRTSLDAVNQITDQSDQMRTINQINMMSWIEWRKEGIKIGGDDLTIVVQQMYLLPPAVGLTTTIAFAASQLLSDLWQFQSERLSTVPHPSSHHGLRY